MEELEIYCEMHRSDGFTLSAIVDDTYYKKRYIDYDREEAEEAFREYVDAEERKNRVFVNHP